MKRALTFVGLSIFLVVSARAAPAAPVSAMLPPYARALQRFNPRLDETTALTLAAATIAQADRQGLDARLLVALIAVESRWDPSAQSSAGARGLGQLMPATANGLGVDSNDPLQNIAGAARHLRAMLDRFGSRDDATRYVLALAAYNAGAATVERYGGVPPYAETKRYVVRVITLWRRLAGRP